MQAGMCLGFAPPRSHFFPEACSCPLIRVANVGFAARAGVAEPIAYPAEPSLQPPESLTYAAQPVIDGASRSVASP
jgi:hypothetical protein